MHSVTLYSVVPLFFCAVAAWFDKPIEDPEIKKFKGNDVTFVCAAQGFPLQVEWKVQKKGEDKIQTCISKSCHQCFMCNLQA